jgi:hypothetical protein
MLSGKILIYHFFTRNNSSRLVFLILTFQEPIDARK